MTNDEKKRRDERTRTTSSPASRVSTWTSTYDSGSSTYDSGSSSSSSDSGSSCGGD